MAENGKEVQRKRYGDIRADVPLQSDLYDTQVYRMADWIESIPTIAEAGAGRSQNQGDRSTACERAD